VTTHAPKHSIGKNGGEGGRYSAPSRGRNIREKARKLRRWGKEKRSFNEQPTTKKRRRGKRGIRRAFKKKEELEGRVEWTIQHVRPKKKRPPI